MSKNKNIAIKSAETVAALRAATVKETDPALRNPDYLAKNFLGLKYKLITSIRPQSLLKNVVNKISPGSYCFSIIRTRHFDNILDKEIDNGMEQLVLLGAGYDTRPLRFADKLKGVKVFEVDFPGTQNKKKSILQEAIKSIPGNIRFIALDFNDEPFETALKNAGFDINKKTLFIWEGVSYYLPDPVVRSVLTFVRTCAESSSIAFDYATKKFVAGDYSTYGGKQVAEWLKKINEPFVFGLDAIDTPDFIHECGLSIVSDLGPEELEKLYLINNKGKFIGKTFGHIRMVHATINKKKF